jgi:hypothetical protein
MPRQAIFNGQTFTQPQAASATDASGLQTASLGGNGIVAIIGEAAGGAGYNTGTVYQITPANAAAMRKLFQSGPLADAVTVAFDPANDTAVPAGASLVLAIRVQQAVQSSLVLNKSSANLITLTSAQYGTIANLIKVTVTNPESGTKSSRVITIQNNTDTPVVSPELAFQDTAALTNATLSMVYSGAGTVVTVQVKFDRIHFLSNGVEGNTDFLFANYPDINSLVSAMNITAGAYLTTTIINTSYQTLPPNTLDHTGAVNLLPAATVVPFYSGTYQTFQWLLNNQSIVIPTLTAATTDVEGQIDTLSQTFMSGGGNGSGVANSDWQGSLDLLKTQDSPGAVMNVVTLASADGVSPDTYTIASVNAALDAHCAAMSVPTGKRERNGHASIHGSKSTVESALSALNSFNTTMCAQQLQMLDATATLTYFAEWGFALVAACMRAGIIEEGEPLTHKFLNATAIKQDSSWSPELNGDELLLAGLFMAQNLPGRGIRIIKGVMSYTQTDNDALVEESIVVEWKAVQRRIRERLEDKFIGQKADVTVISAIKQEIVAGLEIERENNIIVDSVVNGVVTRGYSDPIVNFAGGVVNYSFNASMAPGINFIFGNQILTPVSISV